MSKHSTDSMCNLEILDYSGCEEYSALKEEPTRNSQAFLIVFSITSRSSFEEAMFVYEICCRLRSEDSIPAVLCANKSDVESEREVSDEEALRWADSHNIPMFTVSAKKALNITEAFIRLVQITPRTGVDYKIAVFGASCVGKTAIIIRFVQNQYLDHSDPTIADTYFRQIAVPGLLPLSRVGQPSIPEAHNSISKSILKAAKRFPGSLWSLIRSIFRS